MGNKEIFLKVSVFKKLETHHSMPDRRIARLWNIRNAEIR